MGDAGEDDSVLAGWVCLSNLRVYGRGLCISISISFFFLFKLYIKRKWCEKVFKSCNMCYSLAQLYTYAVSVYQHFLCRCSVTPYHQQTQAWLATNQIHIREPHLVITLLAYSSLDPFKVHEQYFKCWCKITRPELTDLLFTNGFY